MKDPIVFGFFDWSLEVLFADRAEVADALQNPGRGRDRPPE
jgi:hypothetical protein